MIDTILLLFPFARRWLDAPQEEQIDEVELAYAANHAAESGDLARLRELLKARDVDPADPDGRTPLIQAASSGQLACLRWLIKAGANTLIADNMGQTALHHAASEGQVEACRILLPVSEVDAIDTYGERPLNWAVRHGSVEVVELLAPGTTDCRAAFIYAVVEGKAEVARRILPRVDPRNCFLPRKGTPLRSSASLGRASCLALILPVYGENERAELVRALTSAREGGHHEAADLIAARLAELDKAALELDMDAHALAKGQLERAKPRRL